MVIEELQKDLYIKSTDTVEKYLLNIIQEYFRDSNEALEGSKEYIIREAVDRLRTEMDYNALGVLSVTLPNGEVRVGDINITLEDLGGEPIISPKLSAFNVNFGNTANTACEGNDPRLSDARKPTAHKHEIEDIQGLEGFISTIIGLLEREDVYRHEHSNKDVLDILTYTGDKDKIDLNILDTLEDKITEITERIKEKIVEYTEQTNNKILLLNNKIEEVNHELDLIRQYVIEKCAEYLLQAKQYTDSQIDIATRNLKTFIDNNYVNKQDIIPLIEAAQNTFTLVGTERWPMTMVINTTEYSSKLSYLQLSQRMIDKLQQRQATAGNGKVRFEFYVEYVKNNVTYRQPLPYLEAYSKAYRPYMFPISKDLSLSGFIESVVHTNNSLQIAFKTEKNQLPSDILNGNLVCDIFAKVYCPVSYF